MKIKTILLFLLFFVALPDCTGAASPENSELIECKNLLEKGLNAISKGNYPEAIEYYSKGEIIAKKYNNAKYLYRIKHNVGRIYFFLSNYGEALGYYNQALDIAKKNPELNDRIPLTLINIGILYSSENDNKNALIHYKEAYSNIIDGQHADYVRLGLAINMADVYNIAGNYKEAQKYLNQVDPVEKHKGLQLIWKVNYAESLLLEGKVRSAQKMMEETLHALDTKNYANEHFAILQMLTKIYKKQGKLDLAIQFANKGLEISEQMKNRIATFDFLSKVYLEKKEYDLAFQYKDSVLATKDSMAVLVNRDLFESNKVRLKIQDYQNELKINNEKNTAERNIFLIVILFSLLLFFLIFRNLRNRITKQKQERIIVENQQKISNLELENLKNNIGEKNRKLSAKALYLSGRNELIEEIINELSQITVVNQNKDVSKYIKTLKEYIKTDSEWEEFVAHFEKVNPGLLKTLKEKHPELTAKDIRFLCYVYMNLDAKELSIVFNITPDACRRRERRLLQKMNLNTDASLFEYLLEVA